MTGVKAHFRDKFGVTIEVQTPYDAEDLYTLWLATKAGAKITILVRGANKRVMRLDIRDLDENQTFSEIIIAAHSSTIPPPPPLPEMAVHDPARDTLPSERDPVP